MVNKQQSISKRIFPNSFEQILQSRNHAGVILAQRRKLISGRCRPDVSVIYNYHNYVLLFMF